MRDRSGFAAVAVIGVLLVALLMVSLLLMDAYRPIAPDDDGNDVLNQFSPGTDEENAIGHLHLGDVQVKQLMFAGEWSSNFKLGPVNYSASIVYHSGLPDIYAGTGLDGTPLDLRLIVALTNASNSTSIVQVSYFSSSDVSEANEEHVLTVGLAEIAIGAPGEYTVAVYLERERNGTWQVDGFATDTITVEA